MSPNAIPYLEFVAREFPHLAPVELPARRQALAALGEAEEIMKRLVGPRHLLQPAKEA